MKPSTRIALDKTVPVEDLRLYLYLCNNAAAGGWIEHLQSYLAEIMGVTPAGISASFQRLAARGYMEKRVNARSGRTLYQLINKRQSATPLNRGFPSSSSFIKK